MSAVESEIVPRLLALSGRAPTRKPADAALIAALADAAVAGEAEVVESHVRARVLDGANISDAMTDLISAAAQALGRDWEEDRRDFIDITIGTGTLQQVVLSLTRDTLEQALPGRRILLGAVPGEHHTLGLTVLDHLFRSAHWEVDPRPYADRNELVEAVGAVAYAVVGLSLSGDELANEARRTVGALREASKEPDVKVMLGGPALVREPQLGRKLGADAIAIDGRAAVSLANAWFADGPRTGVTQ